MKTKESWFASSDLETCGVCWQQPREGAEPVLWFSSAERRPLTEALQTHWAPACSALPGNGGGCCGKHPTHPGGPPGAWAQCSADQPQVLGNPGPVEISHWRVRPNRSLPSSWYPVFTNCLNKARSYLYWTQRHFFTPGKKLQLLALFAVTFLPTFFLFRVYSPDPSIFQMLHWGKFTSYIYGHT